MELLTILLTNPHPSCDIVNANLPEPWYIIVAKIVAIPAFLISLWSLLSPKLSKLKLSIIPETQIQIIEDSLQGKKILAFNVLFTIVTKGPTNKWETYKFIHANVLAPDGRTINFVCRSYLEEKALGQVNLSRNIPYAINGGQSKTTTASFQTSEITSWVLGKYKVEFSAITSNENKINCKKITFVLDEKSIAVVKTSLATLTIKSEFEQ